MYKLLFVLVGLSFFTIAKSNPTAFPFKAGAGFAATGFSSGTLPNHWSIFYNSASLAGIDQFSAGISINRLYNVEGLGQGAFAIAYPISENFALGAGAFFFGNEFFSEQRFMLSGARRFQKLKAGVQFNLFVANDILNGSTYYPVAAAGVVYPFSEKIEAGFHIFNPFLLASRQNEFLFYPAEISGSFMYKASQQVNIRADLRHRFRHGLNLGGGFDYKFSEKFSLQAGILMPEVSPTFGAGFQFEKLKLNIAFTNHLHLGYSPYLSFDYFQKEPL